MRSFAILATAMSLLAAMQDPVPDLRTAQRLVQSKDFRAAARALIKLVDATDSASVRTRAASMLALVAVQLVQRRDLLTGADAYGSLVAVARRSGRRDESLQKALNNQGYCLNGLGQAKAALPLYEEALQLVRERYLDEHPEVAKVAMNVAACHFTLGNLEAAESLMAKFHVAGRQHDLAVANLHLAAGRPARALPLFEAGEATLGPRGAGVEGFLEVRIAHAQCLMDLARFAEATDLLVRTRDEIERRNGDAYDLVQVDGTLAVCLQQAGQSEKAIQAADRALARFREDAAAVDSNWLTAHSARLAAMVDLGRYQDAVTAAEQLVAATRSSLRDDHPDTARALATLGACLVQNGQVRAGIDRYRESLAMRTTLLGDEHADVARGHDALGAALLVAGEAPAALRQFDTALAMRRRLFASDHPDLATSYNNLGNGLTALGRLDEALRAHEQALAIFQRLFLGDHPDVALALHNVAAVQFELRLPASEATRAASLAMYRRLFEGDNQQIVRALNNLAAECLRRGDPETARVHLEEAVAMFRHLGVADNPDGLRLYYTVAWCAEMRGDLDAACAGYRDEIEACRRIHGGDSWELVGATTSLARCRQRQHGDAAEVEALLATALAATERLRDCASVVDAETRTQYFLRLKDVGPVEELLRCKRRRGDGPSALDLLERTRGRELLDRLHDAEFDPLAVMLAREQDPARRAAVARLSQDLAQSVEAVTHLQRQFLQLRGDDRSPEAAAARALHEQLAAAEDALRRQRTEEARLVAAVTPPAAPATHEQVQAQLQDGDLMLYYVLGETSSMLLVVPRLPAAITFVDIPLGRDTVTATVDRWLVTEARMGGGAARGRDPAPAASTAASLRAMSSALLPAAVWAQVLASRRVFVVPDGALHRLPFEALVVAGTDRELVYWLDRGPPVAYAPSGSFLVWARGRASAPRQEPTIDVAAVGDVDFAGHEAMPVVTAASPRAVRGDFAPLPGTRAELAALAGLVAPERLRCLTASGATEAQLATVAGDARILHLATHGLAEEFAGSSLSALVFATKPGSPASDDGFLHLQELLTTWNNRCAGCELVVLSACRTAIGRDRKDEATAALPIGFFHAGARSVVASIWSVDDESTALLMAEFYGQLFRDRQLQRVDRLAALHTAKRALRRTHPAPYHWAPFLYFGSPD